MNLARGFILGMLGLILVGPPMGMAATPFEDVSGVGTPQTSLAGSPEVASLEPIPPDPLAIPGIANVPEAVEMRRRLDWLRRSLGQGNLEHALWAIDGCRAYLARHPSLRSVFSRELDELNARFNAFGFADLPAPTAPSDDRPPTTSASGSPTESMTGVPVAPPPDPPSEPAVSTTDSLRNEVLYGIKQLRARIAAKDPNLPATIAWTQRRLGALKSRRDKADTKVILEAISALRNARASLSQEKRRNEVLYGTRQLRARMAAKDPTLPATIAWTQRCLEALKACQDPADAQIIQAAEQVLREARHAAARLAVPTAAPPGFISEKGRQQMKAVVEYAKTHHRGGSKGFCFNAVWGYLTATGYGNLDHWNDLPAMGSGEARFFAEYLNASPAHLEEAGLQRLDTALTPPITSPHDSRIPVGAVIVVAAGSYGTAHPTAGDIVIKAGPNRFINDGPNMDYGTKDTWYGKLLGVYVPR